LRTILIAGLCIVSVLAVVGLAEAATCVGLESGGFCHGAYVEGQNVRCIGDYEEAPGSCTAIVNNVECGGANVDGTCYGIAPDAPGYCVGVFNKADGHCQGVHT
jgi:hypothetical protein